MKKRIGLVAVALICLIAMAKVFCPPPPQESKSSKKPSEPKSAAYYARPFKDPKDLRPEGSWKEASEEKAYPNISKKDKILVRVSIKGNRVYILKNGKVAYTMLSTAGSYKNGKSLTPTGKFKVRTDRDTSFFNYELNEGANYWTSWSKNNVYLFHSVPTLPSGKYNEKEAVKLGKKQGSHGCVRLSVKDAKWFMEHIPENTPVIIKDE